MNRIARLLLAGLLAGCSGTGSLQLELTDAPPDVEAMEQVVVTLARAQAHLAGHGAKDGEEVAGGWVDLPLAAAEYDLLLLQDGVTAPLASDEVPEGKLTQIRIHIDPAGRNEVVLKSGAVCPLDLTAVDSGGVKINHPFKAFEIRGGTPTRLVVDFDLRESISKEGECRYKLLPVLKLKAEASERRARGKK